MQIFLRIGILICCLCAALQVWAYIPSSGNITATFGPYFYQTNDNDSGADSPIKVNFGLIANGDVNEKGSLEIAIFRMDKTYFRSQNGKSIAEATDLLEITMGYRHWWSQWFSSSLSFFSAYSMGSPRILQSDFPAGQAIETSARATASYGLDFDLQQELWSKDRYAVVIDERYSWWITHKSSEKADQYSALIGLRYLIEEKTTKK